ncbi:hypothetical protein HYFRA_00008942 [Hymenoscyphus fraxineus]|uniref:Uncharacterized protein n=1 Tax=Hymenoscyphus fraxineus TaxID=746836 RepID=A0A9N9PH71_9HELO|nr:hypothetical protein HYFRA_00008942 [Hymenoscyphus fraxineus]
MDTVNNIASAASRAIWGEGQDPNNPNTTTTTRTSGQEPVAGELGDVKHGEPYDKGNMENSSVPRTIPEPMVPSTGASNTTAGPHDSNVANKADPRVDSDLDGSKKLGTTGSTGSNPALTNASSSQPPSASHALASKTPNTNTSEIPGNTPATQPIRPEHDTDKTGVISAHQPTSATSTTKPTSSNDTAGTGPTPSVSAAPAPTHDTSASHPSNIEQGSLNPKDTPSSTQKDVIKDTKRDIETSAKHTGGAPEYHTGNAKYTEEEGTPGGMPDTIKESLKEHEGQGEGTGEKYVKSSGMSAEGGDFDAANPGAGREADSECLLACKRRLLAEKGVHHEPAVKKTTEDSHTSKDTHTSKESSGSGEKGKVSLGEKIKDKLHIHKH